MSNWIELSRLLTEAEAEEKRLTAEINRLTAYMLTLVFVAALITKLAVMFQV